MDRFMINFDADTRVQEIMNAAKSLDLRFDELRKRTPKSIVERMEILNEMVQIANEMERYKLEMGELTRAKMKSVLGNIDRMNG